MSRRWEGTGLLAQTTILLSTETLGRRQTEARISPMVPTRDQSLDLFQEQGEELFLLWKVVTVTLDGGGELSILYCTVLGYLIIIMHAVFFYQDFVRSVRRYV